MIAVNFYQITNKLPLNKNIHIILLSDLLKVLILINKKNKHLLYQVDDVFKKIKKNNSMFV